jgi:hypothetical protein
MTQARAFYLTKLGIAISTYLYFLDSLIGLGNAESASIQFLIPPIALWKFLPRLVNVPHDRLANCLYGCS